MLPEPKTSYFDGFPWAMYTNAEWQLEQYQYAAGILLAQVACEMGARNAFAQLIGLAHGWPVEDDTIAELVSDGFSFLEESTRRRWTELTGGDRVTKPKHVWVAYSAHVERRNRVAHGVEWGDSNGGQNARASVAAAGAFIARLDSVMHEIDQAHRR